MKLILQKPYSGLNPNIECQCLECSMEKSSLDLQLSVFIQKPIKRTLALNYSCSEVPSNYIINSQKTYYLSFPYVVFCLYTYQNFSNLMNLNCLKVGFALEENPVEIYAPPLGNIYSNLKVCTGIKELSAPKEEFAKLIISRFWQSQFNCGVTHQLVDWPERNWSERNWKVPLADPRVWQEKTKSNPDWMPEANDLCYFANFKNFVIGN